MSQPAAMPAAPPPAAAAALSSSPPSYFEMALADEGQGAGGGVPAGEEGWATVASKKSRAAQRPQRPAPAAAMAPASAGFDPWPPARPTMVLMRGCPGRCGHRLLCAGGVGKLCRGELGAGGESGTGSFLS